MAVKEGYKQTEVGVIPEDWLVNKLRDIASMKSGDSITAKDIKDYGKYPCYGGNGLRGHTHNYTHKGNYALIGRQGALCGNVQFVEGTFFASEHAVVVDPYKGTDIKWLSYVLKDMNLNQYSESSAQPGLSVNKLLELKTQTPKTEAEQKAIATALSDMDGLINSLSNLIEKKKNIKQGAMQELLTGKKRFEGFSGEWVDIELKNTGHFISGNGFPIRYQSSKRDKYPFYKVSDFNNSGNEKHMSNANNYISEITRRAISAKIIPKGSIIFAKIGAAIYLERKRISSVECCIDNNMMCFVCDESVLASIIAYYYLLNIKLSDYASATALPSLSTKDLGKIKLFVPSTIEEQSAIATILSDMDSEIETLQAKLNKYKAIKQGMMQELLTGRIRLLEGA